MRISRIRIRNFRNFADFDVATGEHAVFVGANRVGKSNLVHAIRLVLDPVLPDSARYLRLEDIWDGVGDKLNQGVAVEIAIDLSHFDDSDDLIALLAEHLISGDPLVARLTYRFQTKPNVVTPKSEADFEYVIYGGDKPDNIVSGEVRRRIPAVAFEALRDAESDLERWRRSPLRPLLDTAAAGISEKELTKVVDAVNTASQQLTDQESLESLLASISTRLQELASSEGDLALSLGLAPVSGERLVRSLRLFIDEGARSIADASLGSANLIYLALKTLELQWRVSDGQISFPILAIEEPEAHLHPQLQRLVYRDFLRTRTEPEENHETAVPRFILLTTHSPNIVSVAPVRSLVVMTNGGASGTIGHSAAEIDLNAEVIKDLERYLDVTRGEIVFAKGVILVEGMAEEFLVPHFARLLGYDLDRLGISVCAVAGTNFEPYVALLRSLGIAFVVLTDGDPNESGASDGERRLARILTHTYEKDELKKAYEAGEFTSLCEANGLFLNSTTLETELLRAKASVEAVLDTILESNSSSKAKKTVEGWKKDPTNVPLDEAMTRIETIGKGRFAQRLCARLEKKACPKYIANAIRHLAKELDGEPAATKGD